MTRGLEDGHRELVGRYFYYICVFLVVPLHVLQVRKIIEEDSSGSSNRL